METIINCKTRNEARQIKNEVSGRIIDNGAGSEQRWQVAYTISSEFGSNFHLFENNNDSKQSDTSERKTLSVLGIKSRNVTPIRNEKHAFYLSKPDGGKQVKVINKTKKHIITTTI